MAAKAVLDLVSNDKRFLASMNRVQRAVVAIEAKMGRAAASAKRMLLVGAVAIAGFLKLAANQIAAETKLAAVLKATGNAAGVSLDEIKKYASELQRLTGIGDEATISMASVLATFKDVKGDVFRRAMKLVLDMNTVLAGAGEDVSPQRTAIQLGKALNDPILGITALRRVGVSFSVVQLELIKNFVKTNQLAKAQGVILDELSAEFGGAAVAMGKTFVGTMKRFVAAVGDIGEAVGDIFIPDIEKMMKVVLRVQFRIADWIRANKRVIVTILGITGATAALTIGVHLATKAFIAGTIAVKAMGVAMLFFWNHPIIVALGLIAGAVTALMFVFRDAAERAIELEHATTDLTGEVDKQSASYQTLHGKLQAVIDKEKERQELMGKDAGARDELLGRARRRRDPSRPFLPGISAPGEHQLIRERPIPAVAAGLMGPPAPLMGPPEPPFSMRVLRTTAQRLAPLSASIAQAWERIQEASDKVNKSLDEEATKVKEGLKTDKERTAEQVKRINLLQAAGRLTAEEAAKERARLTATTAGVAAIEDSLSMFRRITIAAASLRPGGGNTLAQQTAKATAQTAQNTKDSKSKLDVIKATLDGLFQGIQEIISDGLKTEARFN